MPETDPSAKKSESASPMDRMMRFGTALFAVSKDELPKRAERKKAPRKKRAAKPEPT